MGYDFKYDFPTFTEMQVEVEFLLRYVKDKIEKGEAHKMTSVHHSDKGDEKGLNSYEIYVGEYPDRNRPRITLDFWGNHVNFQRLLRGSVDIPEWFKEIAGNTSSIDIYLP